MAYDELYHWGIKGQKWGVRRYRNEDGTLTDAGKKRYSSKVKESVFETIKEHKDSIRDYVRATKPSNVKRMSDKDLDERIERLKKEDQFRDLSYKRLSNGEKFTHDVLSKSGKVVATGVAIYMGRNFAKKIFGSDVGADIKLPKK